jgi:very-short-patch-repair endonuclease
MVLDGRNPGDHSGIRVHRHVALTPQTFRWCHGIPLTSPVDTLLGLAATASFDQLEAACALTLSKHLASRERLRTAVSESPPRPGIDNLRRLVGAESGPEVTRSENERLMLRLVRQAELPPPECNVIICGKEVDLYWPDAKLAVEVDAFGTHGAPRPFEADRELDADFKAAGIEVLRFTGRRIRANPHAVLARLAAVLSMRLGGLPVKRWR